MKVFHYGRTLFLLPCVQWCDVNMSMSSLTFFCPRPHPHNNSVYFVLPFNFKNSWFYYSPIKVDRSVFENSGIRERHTALIKADQLTTYSTCFKNCCLVHKMFFYLLSSDFSFVSDFSSSLDIEFCSSARTCF